MQSPHTKHARQLLIALDESPASHAALKYCGSLFSGDPDTGYHLVHCTTSAVRSLLSAPVGEHDTLMPKHREGTDHRFEQDLQLLEKGAQLLESLGVPAGCVKTSLVPAANQVHQAIAMEAGRTLADAIVVARRGIGYFGEIILGSVSASLFRSSPPVPLWIIDGCVCEKDILIGVDGSVQALRAVEHVAHMLRGTDGITVYLYHCAAYLAPEVVCSVDRFYGQWDRHWCDTHLRGDGCLFNGPVQLLREAGIDPARIVVLPETKNLDESTSIITQAANHRCGTIVIGRRGPSAAKGFFGGVTNRTIRQTQNRAVWVIG